MFAHYLGRPHRTFKNSFVRHLTNQATYHQSTKANITLIALTSFITSVRLTSRLFNSVVASLFAGFSRLGLNIRRCTFFCSSSAILAELYFVSC